MNVQAAIICAIVYVVIRVIDNGVLSWQTLARPIVTAPIVGLLLGDLTTGVIMGAQLEAVFMGISAIGGAVASDAFSATIIAVAYAIVVGGADAMEAGMALAMTIGTIMVAFNGLFTPLWAGMAAWWERLAAECNPKKFLTINLIVYPFTCLPNAIVIFVGVAFGISGLESALAAMPAWVMTGLSAAGAMMTAVGFGILLSMIWDLKICAFYFVGFIMAKSLGLSSLGIAVIGACVALTIFFIEANIVNAKNSAGTAPAATGSEEDFF